MIQQGQPDLFPFPVELKDQLHFIGKTLKVGGELHRFILEHGRNFVASESSKSAALHCCSKRGLASLIEACLTNTDWCYAEGFVTTPAVRLPQVNGWLVDRDGHALAAANGANLDRWQFFGFAFQPQYLIRRLSQGSRLPLLLDLATAEISTLPVAQWKYSQPQIDEEAKPA